MKDSRRRFFSNLLVSALAIVWVCLTLEVVLLFAYNPKTLGTVIRFNSQLGWSLAPGATLQSTEESYGVEYSIRVNSFGVRDREFDQVKPPGRRRVLVLGDSFTFGSGVSNDWRFTDFLGRALGDDVEVINTGVPGWGTDQELLYFESVAEQLQPDIVVLTMMTANDIPNNMLDHLFMRSAPKPRFVLDGEALRLTNSPLQAPRPTFTHRARMLLRRSHLLLFIKHRLDRTRHEVTPAPTQLHVPEWLKAHPDIALTHWSAYRTTYDDSFEEGFRVTEAILLRLADRCRSIDAELLVFSFPLRIELDESWREELMAHRDIDPAQIDISKPYRRLSEFCERHDIAYVYPVEEFDRVFEHQYLYFERDEHPSIHGHALAARILLAEFKRRYALDYQLARSDLTYYDAVR